MIRINARMTGVNPVLRALTYVLPAKTRREATRAAAGKYTSLIREYIRNARPFITRTGNLVRGIYFRMQGDDAVISVRGPAAAYAEAVEFGTRPHIIRPRRAGGVLAFRRGSEMVFARQVNHPGTAPHPYLYVHQRRRLKESQMAAVKSILKNFWRR